MRTPRHTDERGMALAVAIFALVIIGALVAGVFYAGTLEQRTGRNSLYAAEASQAAEAGPTVVMANWDQYALNNLPNNQLTPLGTTSVGGRADMKATTTVTRLNSELFLIQSLGTRVDATGHDLAARSVATVARLSFVSATAKAAVTVTKPIKFNGNAFSVIGNDSIPKGWDTDSLGTPIRTAARAAMWRACEAPPRPASPARTRTISSAAPRRCRTIPRSPRTSSTSSGT